MTVAAGVQSNAVKAVDFKRVTVDTTVQEKAVSYPTDSRLLNRSRVRLVRLCHKQGVVLRQSYARKGPRALQQATRYGHAKQYRRLLAQQKQVTNKLYSLHAPEMECISKGKVAKRYDKSSGQTIYKVRPVLCPCGASLARLDCSNLLQANLCTAQAARSVVPREGRNHLKGTQGDARRQLNVLLSCAGHNLRLILRRLRFFCLEKRILILAWLRLLVPAERLSGAGTQLNRKLAGLAPLPAPIMAT